MCVRNEYEFEQPIDGYDARTVLEVTARYGSSHRYDVRLDPVAESVIGSIELGLEELNSISTPADGWEGTSAPTHI